MNLQYPVRYLAALHLSHAEIFQFFFYFDASSACRGRAGTGTRPLVGLYDTGNHS